MNHHREHLEALGRATDSGDAAAMPRFFSEDYRRYSEEGVFTREEFAAALAELHVGFPDLRSVIHDVLSDGNKAACRWSATGTHLGVYLGVPPTHRQIRASGITISLFGQDGRIVEDWASWNRASVLHSLGIVPLG